MSLKSKLILDTLIQENDANYLNYRNSDLEYKLVDSILQEAMQLFENEGDGHFKRNWGKYAAGLGVGGVLANGGTFGPNVQHATQSILNTANNVGRAGVDKATAGLDKSAEYYGKELEKPVVAAPIQPVAAPIHHVVAAPIHHDIISENDNHNLSRSSLGRLASSNSSYLKDTISNTYRN